MKSLWLLATLLALASCGRGNYLPEPAPADLPTREIIDVRAYSSDRDWQRTPWYRASDAFIPWPIFILVANDGFACIVPAKVWAIAQPQQRYACVSVWRFPRGVPRP